ncbi:transmembrane protein, putative [Medicago truncatula]|uniref:Transmembrane protein, putative n=1 Tax=Medicago truncatula TaxID=3880 RepID=G7KTP0_MEDTR|nr:transmembrane protein, putative [Medicago truncatula]
MTSKKIKNFLTKLPTKDGLLRRQILHIDDTLCVGGCGSAETANHPLFSCDTFGSVWLAVLQWLRLSFVAPARCRNHFIQLVQLVGFPRSSYTFLQIIWMACVWIVWMERTNHVFHQLATTPHTLKLSPNLDKEDGPETVLEVPIIEEIFTHKSGTMKAWQNVKFWMKPNAAEAKAASMTTVFGGRNLGCIQLLLGVVGAQLIIHLSSILPTITNTGMKRTSIKKLNLSWHNFLAHKFKDTKGMFGNGETRRKENKEERKSIQKCRFPCMVAGSKWKESFILMGPTGKIFPLMAAKKVG